MVRACPRQRSLGARIQLHVHRGKHLLLTVLLTLRGFTGRGHLRFGYMSYIGSTEILLDR
jgi:hypothetical protein